MKSLRKNADQEQHVARPDSGIRILAYILPLGESVLKIVPELYFCEA